MAIKTERLCNSCRWGVGHECSDYIRCDECPRWTKEAENGAHSCECTRIDFGKECEWYEKYEGGDRNG